MLAQSRKVAILEKLAMPGKTIPPPVVVKPQSNKRPAFAKMRTQRGGLVNQKPAAASAVKPVVAAN